MKFDSSNQVVVSFNPNASADIVLAIGADWVKSNPIP
jgi:hypothetical protein